MKWTRSRTASALALGTASAVLLSACGSSDPAETTDPTTDAVREDVTLSFNFWGTFITDELKAQYEEENPNVTLEFKVGDYGATHDELTQALLAGSGAANIAAIDEGFITGFVAQADGFVNLLDLGAGQYEDKYLDWKWAASSNADGSVNIGLGSDVGGLALCYRKDLFEAAGLPTERADVEAATAEWSDFIALGTQYKEATGKFFVDSANSVYVPALTQTGNGYYNRNNELDLTPVEPAFQIALDVIEAGISANTSVWDSGFGAGTGEDAAANTDLYAAIACPAWMRGNIDGAFADRTDATWDIADIPGPGGNWGGSYYTIPNQGSAAEQQEAYNFIEWIIQPEQQIAIFQAYGNLPSQPALYEDAGIKDFTVSTFGDAPFGQILSKTALDIPGAIYYAPKHNTIRDEASTVLSSIENGEVALADGWAAFVAAAELADAA